MPTYPFQCDECGAEQELTCSYSNLKPPECHGIMRRVYTVPQINGDAAPGGINGIQSMADGKYYDSKSSYYKSLKEKGLIITDGKPKESRPADVGGLDNDIRAAIQKHKG